MFYVPFSNHAFWIQITGLIFRVLTSKGRPAALVIQFTLPKNHREVEGRENLMQA